MTDSEKLDLILRKLENHDQKFEQIDEQFNEIKGEIKEIKSEVKELRHMDTLILDEVERVHDIFSKKTEELEKKIG